MAYSFNAPAAGSSHSSIKPALSGNCIHDVTFLGCESKNTEGKKDKTQTYKILLIKFENEDGYFTYPVFEPKDGQKSDFVRPTEDIMGKPLAFPRPSNVETLMLLFRHLVDAVNPELAAEIEAEKVVFGADSWDALRDQIVKFTKPGEGTKTKIKLIDSKNGATFPFFTTVDKSGNAKVNNNIIGNKLFFNSYEQTRISGPVGAKPSNVPTLDLNVSESGNSKMDQIEAMDFTVLDLN